MTLILIVVVLVVAGVLLGLIHKLVPMTDRIKLLTEVVVILVLVLWLLGQFGLLGGHPHVPRLW